MSEESNEIVLEIEGTPIKCIKRELIEHSDYFKAMFEGNFAERNQSSITLEGIDLKSMNVILTLLQDDTHPIENENILPVLQTTCMLQFERIRDSCIEKLTEMLSPDNCVKIWLTSEPLNLKPLYFKAKNLALTEFDVIKETECLMELNLVQLHNYLSNVYLQCNNEMDVFEVCMKWFYDNARDEIEGHASLLVSLLTCIDFKTIQVSDINEMMTYPDLNKDSFVIHVLNCIVDRRNNIDVTNFYNAAVVSVSDKLFNCNRRTYQLLKDPLFFVNCMCRKKGQTIELFYDRYMRHVDYMKLHGNEDTNSIKKSATILIYDKKNVRFLRFMDVSEEKYNGHEGFHIIGYKEQIFMFGGEVTLGSGNWNLNFWVYDTIRERWDRKTKLPFGRRHFQSVICGNYLYIIGGTGSFRIIQDNMFWYNYRENIWSKQIMLPCAGIQLKCCSTYKNQLFLLNINNKCGYVFIPSSCSFVTLNICDINELVPTYPEFFTIFSYQDKIYIKGSSLIELEIADTSLYVTGYRYLAPINCDSMESVVCTDSVYTLYKHNQTKTVTVEVFSMRTKEVTTPIDDPLLSPFLPPGMSIKIDHNKFTFAMSTKMFSLQHHYKMGETDCFINDLQL